MKNGSHTRTPAWKDRGRGALSWSKLSPSQDWRPGWLCCVSGEIGKESSTTIIKHLIRISTFSNWTVRSRRLMKSGQNCPIGKTLCSIRRTQPHTSSSTHQKLRELDWEVISHPPVQNWRQATKYLQRFLTSKVFCQQGQGPLEELWNCIQNRHKLSIKTAIIWFNSVTSKYV